MPLAINIPHDTTSIELDEYIDIIASMKYDLTCQDDIIDSAKYLNQLNNNKRFLINHMCDELQNIGSFQKSNLYGPQVFILYSNDHYFLRAVVWNPISKIERSIENFKYDICHDHNFDILTAGYCGPGYESRGYTYEYSKTKGMLGEHVELIPQKPLTLSEGKIMLYRAKKDIHIQLPPESVSVSLNLIPRSNSITRPQFQFDESTHRICRYIHSLGSEWAVRIAGVLGDEHAIDVLDSIYEHTPNPHIKAYAAQSIIQISPAMKEVTEERVCRTGDILVTDIFNREMAEYGSSFKIVNE